MASLVTVMALLVNFIASLVIVTAWLVNCIASLVTASGRVRGLCQSFEDVEELC